MKLSRMNPFWLEPTERQKPKGTPRLTFTQSTRMLGTS